MTTDASLECVVNVSEGRDPTVIDELTVACGDDLLDVHTDTHHHRSVFTLVGTDAPRRLARAAVELIDLRNHDGVHPRLGVVDVVPFVTLTGDPQQAVAARDDFARWAGNELGVPCFSYGDDRSLPEVRRGAFTVFPPDTGPSEPHPSAGATAVGARGVLVAYNLWVAPASGTTPPGPSGDPVLAAAKRTAAQLRSPEVRALGLAVGHRHQVSMNLVAPDIVTPAAAWDAAAMLLARHDLVIDAAELVGLVPAAVLEAIPMARWEQLDLSWDRTIEARLEGRLQGSGNAMGGKDDTPGT